MKISLAWLKDWIDLDERSLDELTETLTMIGLEVDAVETFEVVPGTLEGVVIGRVLSVEPHPNADRLRVCQVDAGQDSSLNIVCGAPNVDAGQMVAVALIGTTLYPPESEPLTLKKSKIRGVASEGMICAEDELGLGSDHDGILVLETDLPPGTPANTHFRLPVDTVIEIGLTPNRSDAISHMGVARDLGAAWRIPLKRPQAPALDAYTGSEFAIEVEDAARCPRYSGLLMHGVRVGDSPDWMQHRLRAVGQRPINAIVDITNYILHDIGQPLHAFDLARIQQGRIRVATVESGTTFTTLDEKEHALSDQDLMICDAVEPLCMAGVMGGLNSGVTESTTDIFLESAYFQPATIRATVRRHSIHTETAYRFARSTDPNITLYALERAAELIAAVAGGQPGGCFDQALGDFSPLQVPFRYKRARNLIGVPIPEYRMDHMLRALEIGIEPGPAPGEVVLHVPRYRADVTREQDVIEEILRLYGVDNVPVPERFDFIPALASDGGAYDLEQQCARFLAGLGNFEMRTNPLVGRALQTDTSVPMQHPLSEETAVLRTTMLHSGIEALAWNLNRQQSVLRFFEFGKVFWQSHEGYHERSELALFLTGPAHQEHWQRKPEPADFFALRALLEQLFAWLQLPWLEKPLQDDPELGFGFTLYGDQSGKLTLGRFGQVRQAWATDIQYPVLYAVLDWEAITSLTSKQPRHRFEELPRFPAVRRDLSMLVGPGVRYADLQAFILSQNRKLIRGVNIFDVYQSEGQTSYALSIMLQDPQKTLTDKEVDKVMNTLITKLEKQFDVQIRR